jgi:biopolymer transport protein ExbD
MRNRSHAHATAESHGIDLAPMLDFVVNLLIFFIITAALAGVSDITFTTTTLTTMPTAKP